MHHLRIILSALESSVIVDHLQRQQKLPVRFIYFNYKRQADQNDCHVFGSILRQLCEDPRAFQVIYEYHSSTRSASALVGTQLHAVLGSAIRQSGGAFVILDALDEYLLNYSDNAIRLLVQMLLSISDLKLMVTSRAIGSMESIFLNAGAMIVPIHSASADMEFYIRGRIEKEVSFAARISDLVVAKVMEASKKRFLLAELHLNTIGSLLNIGRIRDALDSLANEIDPAYLQTVRRIKEQDEHRRDLALKTLMLVTTTFRSLSIMEVTHALSIGPDRDSGFEDYLYPADIITAACAGLVVINSKTNQVHLIHMTAQTFFERIKESEFPYADYALVKMFTTYLSWPVPQLPLHLADLGFGLIDRRYRPLRGYITEHFHHHLQKAEKDIFPGLHSVQDLAVAEPIYLTVSKLLTQSMLTAYGTEVNHMFGNGIGAWKIDHNFDAIWVALMLDLPHLLTILLQSGTDPNIPLGTQHLSPLSIAIWCGSRNCVELLLANPGIKADLESQTGLTPLSLAVIKGSVEVVKLLLCRCDVDVNRSVLGGFTPLMLAASRGNEDIVYELLTRTDIYLNTKHPEDSFTALWLAIYNRRTSAVAALVADNRLDYATEVIPDQTPLTYAIIMGNASITFILLQKEHPSPSFRDDGRTLLSYAVEGVMESVVATLIEDAPELVDLPDDTGCTPLSYCRNPNMVRLLLNTGKVRADHPDMEGRTPLSYIAELGWWCSEEATCQMIELLLETGSVNADSRDKWGRTPLSYAAESGSDKVVERLLQVNGVDINFLDDEGRPPLFHAFLGGYARVAETLKTLGASTSIIDGKGRGYEWYSEHSDVNDFDRDIDVSERSEEGRTVLSREAEMGSVDDVIRLLEKGADPNSRDDSGRTPISWAAETSTKAPWVLHHLHTINALLGAGADINEEDDEGLTPLDHAESEEIMVLFEMRGGIRKGGRDKPI